MTQVAIVGAGAWGLALATAARESGSEVIAWNHDPHAVSEINSGKPLTFCLKGVTLAPGIRGTHHLADISTADIIVMAVPAQVTRHMAQQLKSFLRPDQILVIASKGIEIKTGFLMSEVLDQELHHPPAVALGGPNFATEVAQHLPAATVIAGKDAQVDHVIDAFKGPLFRPYKGHDLIGVQIGGSIKNVLAIACGIVDGAGLGENARAALLTRGLIEMAALGAAKGAQKETFYGLAGVGDLILTAMSPQSRNYKFGYEFAKNNKGTVDPNLTVEGMHTALSVTDLAARLKIEMPICTMVKEILYHALPITEAMFQLMARPLGNE